MKRLSEFDPIEVSLVGIGANKRKFLVLKSGDGMTTAEEIQKLMKKVDPAVIAKVDKVLKQYIKKNGTESQLPETGRGVSPQAEAALKAVVRILTPFKDEINDSLLDDVLTGAGVLSAGEPGGTMASKGIEKPDDVSDEMHEKAMKSANAMYKHQVQKLGGRKYPDAEMELKEAGYVHKDGGDLPPKADSHVFKSAITKSDGTLDEKALEAIPENMRTTVKELWSQNKEAITKAAKNEELLQTERKERRTKEFVAKTAEFKNFTGDKSALALQLMDLQDANPALYESTVKNLELIEKQAVAVNKGTFQEHGSDLPGPGGKVAANGDEAWNKITSAAEAYVAKSGEKVSREDAIDKYLGTPDGQRMYAEYKNQRPAGI